MASPSKAEQLEPTLELPTTGSESAVKDSSGSEIDEKEIKKWYLNTYERGSKSPMEESLTAHWDLPVSDTDVKKMKIGLRSRNTDDRWVMLMEDPDENGNISLYILRNWL
ncbi:hypothetical protein SS1G_04577 [Sclerotinia sclerotiorum 1980 UF-70]|uniref:Uncharacterized protein n=2 Tax=Sclerotinia sclerotiorum (strain ATCC 18683 / 1980 / Ss-1) TaxID=665079 RepID=A7EGY5_SCLS1|nr:hypothetical protein SS1G_04577 [Sclerotinia sclerotiorum 1980 UF-70]APA06799.1 hypothetical protein sscle_02g015690 [Sclerotinia sclerotiorum 1980 UF-70]EDO02101.1 hypothetical protein SS1G_04577 [Sclerotinia sclerotiorum 1980 UF-70]